MISRDAPTALKVQFVLWVLAFIVMGVFAAWMGLHALLPALTAVPDRVPIVDFRPVYVMGLPLALALFALAALGLLPSPVATNGRRAVPGRSPAATAIFALVVTSLLTTTVATPIARSVITAILIGRGYQPCPPSDAERRPPLRFGRPGQRCPA